MGKPIVRIVGLIAAATLVASCAAEKKGITEQDAQGSAPGVSAASIKVGGVLTKTSATGYSTADTEIGAKARFERASTQGGVHGRKIELVAVEDDGLVPDKGDAAAKKLVNSDKVFAVVPVSAPQFGGAAFLAKEKVPYFGWGTNPSWCGPDNAFGYNGCLAPKPGAGSQTWWGNQVGAQIGGAQGKSVFVQGTDSSGSKYGVQTISQSFVAAGFTLAGSDSGIAAQAPPQDWSPIISKIMKSNGGKAPDVVVSVMAGGRFNTGLYGALKKAGYAGALTDATSYDPKILKDPVAKQALQGVLTAPMFEPFESSHPDIAQMKSDILKVDPDAAFNQHMAIGYWSADLFIKMAEKAGKNLTRESFLQAANSYSADNPGVGKIEYPKNHSEPNGCGALVKIDGDKFTVAQSLKCFANVPLK